eukprot:gb/GECG01014163.1/.p1 GENE.gb/GECG01014163.1/~~gb/GECG01014163.1/.p1  ORF type:complete len:105 (+),score=22.52 gb/GECG01014163.1/:1-315(+)
MAREVYTQTTAGKALAETLAEFRENDEVPKEVAAAIMRTFYDSMHSSLDKHIDENAVFTLKGEINAINAYQMKLHATVKDGTLKTPEGPVQADEIQVLARDAES